jgi:hypothetical protein
MAAAKHGPRPVTASSQHEQTQETQMAWAARHQPPFLDSNIPEARTATREGQRQVRGQTHNCTTLLTRPAVEWMGHATVCQLPQP